MIKPEQIPDAAVTAAWNASSMLDAIAAALNAWPGMQPQEWHGAGPRLILPLTEASDE